ncbi:MAG: ABC transporter ATP-binding protein [Pseudobutyrivibrio sp.]|nr:ABC transporter ATP-binding protein [Pseudobutyrivibrio sp.]
MSVEKNNKLIELIDVTKSYKKKKVLNGISFTVYSGDIYGFLGANGTGKTTTIKAITGLTRIDSGTIIVNKNSRIGLVSNSNCLYSSFTASENIAYYLKIFGLYDKNKIDRYLKLVGLLNEKNEAVSSFSKGMMRRLVLARILAIDPDILIMDEPLDGLDVSSQLTIIHTLKNWVSEKNRCIIYTSHNMEEVEKMCNKVGFLKDGKIALQGRVNDILKKEILSVRLIPRNNDYDHVLKCINHISDIYEYIDEELYIKADEKQYNAIIDALYKNNIKIQEYNLVYRNLIDIYERINQK